MITTPINKTATIPPQNAVLLPSELDDSRTGSAFICVGGLVSRLLLDGVVAPAAVEEATISVGVLGIFWGAFGV